MRVCVCVCVCRLKDFSEWGQCQVLDLLRRYQPVSEDDLFDVLVSHTHCSHVRVHVHVVLHYVPKRKLMQCVRIQLKPNCLNSSHPSTPVILCS